MSTEITTATATAAYVEDSPLSLNDIPTTSLAEFQQKAFMEPVNRLAAIIQRAGKSDTVLHVGKQIRSEDVAGKILTIVRVGYGMAPANDMQGNPIWELNEDGSVKVDENGTAVQKMSRFPVCHFKEAPGWWYNGGTMLDGIIQSLVEECGDEPDDMSLPNVNAALSEVGGLRAYFDWKDSSKNRGQKYMNIIVA